MATFKEIKHTLIKEGIMSSSEVKAIEIIAKIRALRFKENMSQSELSRRSGIPQKTISRMESGLSYPSVPTLIRLVDTLGYEMDVNLVKKKESK